LNPKLKLALVVLVSTLSLIFGGNLVYMLPVFLFVVALIFLFRIYRKILDWLKFMVSICLVIILIQSFTYSGLGFTFTGLFYGLIFSLRFLTLILLIFIFVHTTPTKQLVEAFDFLPHQFSFMLMLSLSLLPKVGDETKTIVNAQKARGLNFKTLNVFKVYLPILVPLFSRTLEKSQQLALAMQTRSYE